jgi:hypothetical protein
MDIKPFIIKNINIAARRSDVKLVEDSEIKPATSPDLNLNYEPGEPEDQAFIVFLFTTVTNLLGVGRDPCIKRVIESPEGREILRRIRRTLSQLKNIADPNEFRSKFFALNFAAIIQESQRELRNKFPCWNEDYLENAIKSMNAYDKIHNKGVFDQFFSVVVKVITNEEGVVLAPLSGPALNIKIAEKLVELYPNDPNYVGLLGYAIIISEAANAEIMAYLDMIFNITALITALGAAMIAFNGGVAAAASAIYAIVRAAENGIELIQKLIQQGLLPSTS